MSALLFTLSYCNRPHAVQLQSGDLLFTGPDTCTKTGLLSKAIDEVTRQGLTTNFSHVGIAEVDHYGIWVIHAEPRQGVTRESIDAFIQNESHGVVSVYRFKDEFADYIPEALNRAHRFLGQPYDFTFQLGDSAQYCSGLIYKLFEPYDLFELKPMTFIDPQTGVYHPYWVDYFDRLGIGIPEGYLGCNPNGMATSIALKFVGEIKK